MWNNKKCVFGISKDMTKEQEALQKFTKIFNINGNVTMTGSDNVGFYMAQDPVSGA